MIDEHSSSSQQIVTGHRHTQHDFLHNAHIIVRYAKRRIRSDDVDIRNNSLHR